MSFAERILVVPLNHLLSDAPWATLRLAQHAGALIGLRGLPWQLDLQIDAHGLFRAVDKAGRAADVTITLPDDLLARWARDRQAVMSALRLEGQADVAETLAFVARNLRWDAEADLARLVGDIPARRLALIGQGAFETARSGARRAAENVAEYLVRDADALAPPKQLQGFGRDVQTVRDDLARLEKRIGALEVRR